MFTMLSAAIAALLTAASISGSQNPGLSQRLSLCQTSDEKGSHCYVQAQVTEKDSGHPMHGVSGSFTEPRTLKVPRGEYSIGQLWLNNTDERTYLKAVEFGWVVAPGIWHDNKPHLFAAVRNYPHGGCILGVPGDENTCPKGTARDESNPGGIKLGDSVGGKSAFYHIGYHSDSRRWWIQYDSHWIASISDNYWGGKFKNGNLLQWGGEVSADQGNPCIPMGNGRLGVDANSAKVTEMGYEYMENGNSKLAPAKAELSQLTDRRFWNTNVEHGDTFREFRYGGPGKC
ncbi:neprosin family prolyl endopeptidase [Streptomyces sp. NPDC050416]|uniref:neprosin family prolyl endopeptidase n=1 Tax=Streptomyces sp. NPDC050416 TaxID=3365611 RepID=UPI0037B41EE8